MKLMHIAMAPPSPLMFFVWRRVFMGVQWSWMAPNWWSTRLQTSVGVDVHRHGGGLFLPVFATGFPEGLKSASGPKFILPAIDWVHGEAKAVPRGAAGACGGVAVYGVTWDGGYRHDHD